MPTYELSLLLRQMSRLEVMTTIKRTAEAIFDKGGLIRALENLGTRPIPYKMSMHGLVHKTATYFLIKFDSPPNTISEMEEELSRDVDIIRKSIYTVATEPVIECTLSEEILPPAYRKEVQEMIKIGEKKHKPKFQYRSGLDYYPFQK